MEINGVIERKLRLLEHKLDDIKEWKIEKYDVFKKSSLITKRAPGRFFFVHQRNKGFFRRLNMSVKHQRNKGRRLNV